MRGLVSFALGLWTGGLMVGLLWAFYFRSPAPPPTTAVVAVESSPAIMSPDEVRQLRHDNALLGAEINRLRESLLELQSVTHPATDGRQTVPSGPLTPPAAAGGSEAPLALADLERLARENDLTALETLLGSAGEGQQSVLRVWRSPDLSDAHRALIARYLTGVADNLLAELDPAGESVEPATE